MFEVDELKIYHGKDIQINKDIIITIPCLEEISDFGESLYFNAVHTITAVGADLKWQLWDKGIDYTQISDYDLFVTLISQLISSNKRLYEDIQENPQNYIGKIDDIEINDLLINPVSLFLKDIDFADFEPIADENNQLLLYDKVRNRKIDRFAYHQMVDVIRNIHGLKRNNETPANERTKMDLIEDARDEAMASRNKPFKSVLKSLVSTLQVKCGQCGDDKVWSMPISAFLENIKRIGIIQNAELLLQGAYSGFASLKNVDKNTLNIFQDI